jgi:hypothetical protein
VLDLVLYLVACTLTERVCYWPTACHTDNVISVVLLFLGYNRHEWGEVHTWLAYVVVLVGIVHLLLNWQWLVKVAASKHPWRLAVGILAGLSIVGAFLLFPIERPG